MHGLVNKALQDFLVETYGREIWDAIRRDAGIEFDTFEPMMQYDAILTQRVLHAVTFRLVRTSAAFLEDLGTWLVTRPENDSLRRLLRFGGADFQDFLCSLDELPGRVKLAIPHFDVPLLHLNFPEKTKAALILTWPEVNLTPVVAGAVRALADDYGALVLLETQDTARLSSVIEVELLDNSFAEGRDFDLRGAQA